MNHRIGKWKVGISWFEFHSSEVPKPSLFFHYVTFISLIFTYGSAYVNMDNQGLEIAILEKAKLL